MSSASLQAWVQTRVQADDGEPATAPPPGSNRVMMAIIGCPTCNARNRVGPIPNGVPRCPRCKSALPWVVDADTDTFHRGDDHVGAHRGGLLGGVVRALPDDLARARGPRQASRRAPQGREGRRRRESELAASFGAQSIPLLFVIRDGQETDRVVGALPRAALEQRLRPVLAA